MQNKLRFNPKRSFHTVSQLPPPGAEGIFEAEPGRKGIEIWLTGHKLAAVSKYRKATVFVKKTVALLILQAKGIFALICKEEITGKKFLEPQMDVCSFAAEDVLLDSTVGSGLPLPGENETPIN